MTKKNASWGGRFTQSVSSIASKFSNSIDVDSVLAEKDIIGSIAYAESLQEAGVINKSELIKIKRGLNQIKKEIETGKFKWNSSLEDVHMNIESVLEKKIGDSAKKIAHRQIKK
jgi:argininosuccinate lyase